MDTETSVWLSHQIQGFSNHRTVSVSQSGSGQFLGCRFWVQDFGVGYPKKKYKSGGAKGDVSTKGETGEYGGLE